jgi:hypothetical protein
MAPNGQTDCLGKAFLQRIRLGQEYHSQIVHNRLQIVLCTARSADFPVVCGPLADVETLLVDSGNADVDFSVPDRHLLTFH